MAGLPTVRVPLWKGSVQDDLKVLGEESKETSVK